jgi:hypothetical protein
MRNDIMNYATGEPVTTIAVYYDKLVEKDKLKHIKRLNYLCASLYGERGVRYKVADKTAVCEIFQEIADTISIPFQEVFDLWNKDRMLLHTKKKNPIFGGLTNDIFNNYADGRSIFLYFVHEETKSPLLGSFKFVPDCKLCMQKPTWLSFLNKIESARKILGMDLSNRRARVYNTKMLAKSMLGISNKEWKEFYKSPHSLLFEDNRNYLLERISLIMSVIRDYQIDNVLFVCLLERNYLSMTKNKSTAEIAGIVISYFAELIKDKQLRKCIKIEG